MIRLSTLCLATLGLALCLGLILGLARPALAEEAKGKVASVDATKNQIIIKEQGRDVTFQVEKDAKVTINGKEGKLSDIASGDEVTITYEKKGEQQMATEVRCTQK